MSNWTIEDVPDLSGRVGVVTGANDGLGLETARALAGAGAHTVMAVRNVAKAERAMSSIATQHPTASLELVHLDLGSLESVELAAATIASHHVQVDILVNNAGVMAMPEGRTADGFETQFGVNHLGHWALTAHLMPTIADSPETRVVTVTSTAHHFARAVGPDNPHMRGNYRPWAAYGQSKLANYHFALGLQGEFERLGMSAQSIAAHPGMTRTNLQVRTVEEGATGSSGTFFQTWAAKAGMSPAQGALSQVRAATDPLARGGEMYAPRYVTNGPPVRRPILRRIGLKKAIENLWRVSVEETGLTFGLD